MTDHPRSEPHAPRPWLLLCCVLVAVIASYLPVLGAPLIWDDHHLIEHAPLVQELHPLSDYFGQGFWQGDDLERGRIYYRPLTILSLAVDQKLYGGSPGGFHVTNLLFHLLSTALLFRLLRVRGAGGYAATLGTALWALHPRLTEAVAWISGRTDVLALFFVLSALLARTRSSWGGRIVCALCLLLGLLCKEVAVAGVVAVLVAEFAEPGALRIRLQRAIPTLLVTAAYALLRLHASGIVAAQKPESHLSAVAAAVGRYFAMLLTPWFPNVQIGSLDQPGVGYSALGCAVILALLGWFVSRRGRIQREQWAPLALIAVGFGLVLHVVPFSINVVAADRFMYLPLAGLTLLGTPALATLSRANLVAGACALLAASFGISTFMRAGTWSDEVELWAKTFRDNPDNRSTARVQLGRLYARAGLFSQAVSIDRAETHTLFGQTILPNNAATVLARSGRYSEAIQLLAGLAPAYRDAPVFRVNLALFDSYLNDFAAARAELSRALLVDPASVDALSLAQRLPELERQRREVEALPETTAPIELARRLGKLGLAVEALQAWRTALASNALPRPDFEDALWFSLAEGDARTSAEFHELYQARFPERSPKLELAYETHVDLVNHLRAVWPSLGLTTADDHARP